MTGDKLKTLIAMRAYEFWEKDGHRDGRDQLHWLLAEKEVIEAQKEKIELEGGAEAP